MGLALDILQQVQGLPAVQDFSALDWALLLNQMGSLDLNSPTQELVSFLQFLSSQNGLQDLSSAQSATVLLGWIGLASGLNSTQLQLVQDAVRSGLVDYAQAAQAVQASRAADYELTSVPDLLLIDEATQAGHGIQEVTQIMDALRGVNVAGFGLGHIQTILQGGSKPGQ